MGGDDRTDKWDSLLDVDAVAASWSAHPAAPAPESSLTQSGSRFEVHDELGRGAMGVVSAARDLDLQRDVALKRLLLGGGAGPESTRLFLEEARLAGSLEHQNIVPVYELGRLPDGQPFFAMRRLAGRPLSSVLQELARDEPAAVEEFGRARMLTIFLQICGAVDYAHSRGVVHRDLKPANIVVGGFGDVQLLDWGIAARLDDIDRPAAAGPVAGTPGFIAPEILWQRDDVVPRLAEVWALGAVLYELLTFERACGGVTAAIALEATMAGTLVPPRERCPHRKIPVELEEICLGALHTEPSQRPGSAGQLARQVEDFLEGVRERERRGRLARRELREARAARARYEALGEELGAAREQVDALRRRVNPWDRVAEKRPMWAAEDRVRDVEDARDDQFNRAETAYLRALQLLPEDEDATDGLSGLWWERLERSEGEGDRRGVRRAVARIRALEPEAAEERLAGGGRLSLVSTPPGARVWLHRFEQKDRLLLPADGSEVGVTPIEGLPVPMGCHLLMIEAPGAAPLRVPIFVERRSELTVSVRLLSHLDVPEGFVHVPGGPFLFGGAPTPYGVASPPGHASLDDFAIGAFPVTLADYAAFVATLPPSEQAERLPRTAGGEAILLEEGSGWVPHVPPFCPAGERFSRRAARRLPAVGLRWQDAAAYCAWKGELIGRTLCLPTEMQWEKAARGVDGRRYPWGDAWDPGFVNRAGSRAGPARLEPIGQYGMDQSVYGVRDVCGGVREWCRGTDDGSDAHPVRGGDWTRTDDQPLSARSTVPGDTRSLRTGFRLCLVLGAPGQLGRA